MLVYEETANDLHREPSCIEKSRHFVYVHALIKHCARWSRVKFCAEKMRNANWGIILTGFNVSKVIRDYFGFTLQRSDWFKKLAPLSQPIRGKTKTNWLARTRFPALSTGYTYWLPVLLVFLVLFLVHQIVCPLIGYSDNFGFGITTLNHLHKFR